MEVDTAAILVYGYTEEDANVIKQRLDNLCEREVTMIDGSDKEGMVISEILEAGFGASFKENYVKIVMFIGFKGGHIEKCLQFFPRGDIVRPIFCTLTEHNIGWTLEQLIEDLVSEHRAWAEKHADTLKSLDRQEGLPEKTLEELMEAMNVQVEEEFAEHEEPDLHDVDEDVEPISLEGMLEHEEDIEDIDSIIEEIEGEDSDKGDDAEDDND